MLCCYYGDYEAGEARGAYYLVTEIRRPGASLEQPQGDQYWKSSYGYEVTVRARGRGLRLTVRNLLDFCQVGHWYVAEGACALESEKPG